MFAVFTILPALERLMVFAALGALLLGPVSGDAWAAAGRAKISLGAVEEVVLLPWGVRLPARIDTGAAKSSLDARELTIVGNIASFKLADKYGGRRLSLPILHWREVSTSATTSRRPVVEISLCIGSRRIRTQVNLNDRSRVKYPLIIGRNTLSHDFLVDCSASYCTEPSCAGIAPQ